ncbi:MAG: pentapeptide repeat-containing protein [Dermatophilaceae bacterium]
MADKISKFAGFSPRTASIKRMQLPRAVGIAVRAVVWSSLVLGVAWSLGHGLDGGEIDEWPLMVGFLLLALLLADIALVLSRSDLSDPPWWYRDVFIGIIVGCLLVFGQAAIEVQSSRRQAEQEEYRQAQSRAAENLAFVRMQAGSGSGILPFSEFALDGANMNGLPLDEADFSQASLQWSSFRGASLRAARFDGADVGFTDFSGADMQGVSLQTPR